MKSVVALFLGFVFFLGSIFPNTDVDEVYKIPNLIQHYFEHKKEVGADFGFWHFLQLHYGLGSTHAKTHKTDASLPMFQHHCSGFTFVLPLTLSFSYQLPAASFTQLRHSFYQNTYAYLFSITHLRPPKVG